MEHSVATLEAKANVCCVKFNPSSHYNIAFGSAGNLITPIDLFLYYSIILTSDFSTKKFDLVGK